MLRIEPSDSEVADAALRLMRLIERPAALPVLQAQLLREMHYWLMAGSHGAAIRVYAALAAGLDADEVEGRWINNTGMVMLDGRPGEVRRGRVGAGQPAERAGGLFARLATLELLVMAVAAGLGSALARTPTPVPELTGEAIGDPRTYGDLATPAGLRDRALIGLMVYSFARIGAALAMRVPIRAPRKA